MKPFLQTVLLLTLASVQAQQQFIMTQLGENHSLNSPWEILYGPDDMLWITERAGKRVVRIDPETGDRDDLIKIYEVYEASTQDGLLGMALHQDLGSGKGSDYVYLSYTYDADGRAQKLVRYTYTIMNDDGALSDPVDLITGMPGSNDHNSGRLLFGPDNMLYYTIGDQGKNQYENTCKPNQAQTLPTQEEVDSQDWSSYQGKILRLTPDGSIPADNPVINGVQSHIYSFGHRNAQGLVFAGDGTLYSAEHGPKSDDELNRILPGKNYGWPYVAGYIDDQAYSYCQWPSSATCSPGSFDDYGCPGDAETYSESSWSHPDFMPPIQTFYTVADDYDFEDPDCNSMFICWPTIAPSSIDWYPGAALPGWNQSLLIVSLKEGRVYRQPIGENGEPAGEPIIYWDTQNRYRDMAVHPDGKIFYIITDNSGQTSGPSSGYTSALDNAGTILRFEFDERAPLGNRPLTATEITLSPNPANTQISIRYSEVMKPLHKEIRILNMEGKEQYATRGSFATATIPVHELAEGLYIVQTLVEGIVLTKRFVVER